MAKKKSWAEKIASAPEPHIAVLQKPFAGLPAGARLYISSPSQVANYMALLKPGETDSLTEMRAFFAAESGAHGTCPLTSGIFARIVAEDALEQLAAGAPPEAVAPFWRLIDPKSPLAKKLSCGPDFIRTCREAEGSA